MKQAPYETPDVGTDWDEYQRADHEDRLQEQRDELAEEAKQQ